MAAAAVVAAAAAAAVVGRRRSVAVSQHHCMIYTLDRTKAGGGFVGAGNLYRVNERNMEYFQPSVDGQVIPLAPAGAEAGGGMTINIENIHANSYAEGQEAARGLSDEIEFLLRSRG